MALMPSPRTDEPKQPRLHRDVALEVAHVAGVPSEELDQFCELLQGTVQRVWELDTRARPSKPGEALYEAARAARALHKAYLELNTEDRKWLDGFMDPNSYYVGKL